MTESDNVMLNHLESKLRSGRSLAQKFRSKYYQLKELWMLAQRIDQRIDQRIEFYMNVLKQAVQRVS